MNQTPSSNNPLIPPQNHQMNINPGYPHQNLISTNPGSLIPLQNHELIQNQPPIISQVPNPQLYNTQPQIQIQKSLDMVELDEDLVRVTSAEVWKYFQGGVLGFGKAHKYRVKIKFPDGSERNIFIGKRGSNFFTNDKYNFDIRMKYIPRDSTTEILNTKDFDKRHFDIDSNDPCGYKPRIYIKNVENNNNIFMGSIEQPRCCNCCCADANFEIYPQIQRIDALPRYFVTTKGCQCAYCCCEGCSCEETGINFQIFDPLKGVVVGNINKLDFNRQKSTYLVYDIAFPVDATPQEKLFIIFSAVAIDSVEFKQLGGHIK